MNADNSNTLLTDDDVRSAYLILRVLTKEAFLAGFGSYEAELLNNQIRQQENEKSGLLPKERERRADLALAEGLVEVFERAADWIGPSAVTSLSELNEKNSLVVDAYSAIDMFYRLLNLVSYRSCHSTRLASKVATEGVLFFKAQELLFNFIIEENEHNEMEILLQNMILMCDNAPAAIGRYRAHKMHITVRKLYSTSG